MNDQSIFNSFYQTNQSKSKTNHHHFQSTTNPLNHQIYGTTQTKSPHNIINNHTNHNKHNNHTNHNNHNKHNKHNNHDIKQQNLQKSYNHVKQLINLNSTLEFINQQSSYLKNSQIRRSQMKSKLIFDQNSSKQDYTNIENKTLNQQILESQAMHSPQQQLLQLQLHQQNIIQKTLQDNDLSQISKITIDELDSFQDYLVEHNSMRNQQKLENEKQMMNRQENYSQNQKPNMVLILGLVLLLMSMAYFHLTQILYY